MKEVIGGFGPGWIINDQKEIKVKEKVFTELKKDHSWPTYWSELDKRLKAVSEPKDIMLSLAFIISTMGMQSAPYRPQLTMMKVIDYLGLRLGWLTQQQFDAQEQATNKLEAAYRASGYLDERTATPTFDINRGDSTF